MGISSIAFLLLTPLFYFLAGLNRIPGLVGHWAGHELAPTPHRPSQAVEVVVEPGCGGGGGSSVPAVVSNYFGLEDPRGRAALEEIAKLRNGILNAARSQGPALA